MTVQRFFVTGTDTDVGKTYCSTALLRGFRANGVACAALKPIASGVDANGQNPDAAALAAATGQAIAAVNPLSFHLPTAPHLAAQAQGTALSVRALDALLPQWEPDSRDNNTTIPTPSIELIEGAGGWLLPLNQHEYLADWVVAQRWPVLLVVGVKLGCLNHSLLTVRELRRAGVPILGYIANILTPEMHFLAENIEDLANRLGLPCLGVLPYAPAGPSDTECQALATALQGKLAQQ
jgi:dethiobiotin synthetase